MIRPICHDPLILSRKAEAASPDDLPVCRDLSDTFAAHRDGCVGMAANMIGIPKAIIIYGIGPMVTLMLNPVILARQLPYDTQEGCLSLTGVKITRRWKKITIRWQDTDMHWHTQDFRDFPAQILQHQIDHLQGILI